MSTTFKSGDTQPRQDLEAALAEGPIVSKYIGQRIYTPLAVMEPEGVLGRTPIEALREAPDVKRAADSGYNRISVELGSDTFYLDEYGVEAIVNHRKARKYRHWWDYEMFLTQVATEIVLRRQEMRVQAKVHDTNVWTGAANALGVGTAWSNLTSSTPVVQIEQGKQAIRAKMGAGIDMSQFKLQVPAKAVFNLSNHEDVLAKIVPTSNPGATLDLGALAFALGVGEVVVGDAMYNGAGKGLSYSGSEIWPVDKAFLYVASDAPSPDAPAVGRTLYWDEDGGLLTVESYAEDEVRSDIVRVRQFVEEHDNGTEFGFLFTGIG